MCTVSAPAAVCANYILTCSSQHVHIHRVQAFIKYPLWSVMFIYIIKYPLWSVMFIYIRTHSDVCVCPCMLILLIFFHPLPPSFSLPLPSSLSLPLSPSPSSLILRTLYGLAPMDEQPKLKRSIAQLSQVRKFLIIQISLVCVGGFLTAREGIL